MGRLSLADRIRSDLVKVVKSQPTDIAKAVQVVSLQGQLREAKRELENLKRLQRTAGVKCLSMGCPRLRATNRSCCERCLKHRTKSQKARRLKRIAQRICITCTAPVESDTCNFCPKHQQKRLAYQRKRRGGGTRETAVSNRKEFSINRVRKEVGRRWSADVENFVREHAELFTDPFDQVLDRSVPTWAKEE